MAFIPGQRFFPDPLFPFLSSHWGSSHSSSSWLLACSLRLGPFSILEWDAYWAGETSFRETEEEGKPRRGRKGQVKWHPPYRCHWIVSPLPLPEGGVSRPSKQIKGNKHQQKVEYFILYPCSLCWLVSWFIEFTFFTTFQPVFMSIMTSKHPPLHFFFFFSAGCPFLRELSERE